MHSLSLLHKTASSNVGTAAVTTALKQQGRISENVILILDEICHQESAEYFGGDTFQTWRLDWIMGQIEKSNEVKFTLSVQQVTHWDTLCDVRPL